MNRGGYRTMLRGGNSGAKRPRKISPPELLRGGKCLVKKENENINLVCLSRNPAFSHTEKILLKGELKAPLYVLGLNLSQLPRGNYKVLQSFCCTFCLSLFLRLTCINSLVDTSCAGTRTALRVGSTASSTCSVMEPSYTIYISNLILSENV